MWKAFWRHLFSSFGSKLHYDQKLEELILHVVSRNRLDFIASRNWNSIEIPSFFIWRSHGYHFNGRVPAAVRGRVSFSSRPVWGCQIVDPDRGGDVSISGPAAVDLIVITTTNEVPAGFTRQNINHPWIETVNQHEDVAAVLDDEQRQLIL